MNYTNQLNQGSIVKFTIGDHYYLVSENYMCYFYDVDNNVKLKKINSCNLNNTKEFILKQDHSESKITTGYDIEKNILHNELRPLSSGIWKIMYVSFDDNLAKFCEEKILV